ncbi:unnamed protein product [Cylicostephanus goldi]|uniref:P-type domain-containing protein n=1 Tax=Cylicostephanus goldi TaxID=71465 RepID=A0A3P6QS38_CYLGO|nr:unnamed protein product [Cylicostephanus goldi]
MEEEVRFDCHPEPDASAEKCSRRDCIWKSSTAYVSHADMITWMILSNKVFLQIGVPWCFMKPGIGYRILSSSESKTELVKNNGPRTPWGEDIGRITLTSSYIGKTLNVKIGVEGR